MRLLMTVGVLGVCAASIAALYLGVRWARRAQDRRANTAELRAARAAALEEYQLESTLTDIRRHRDRLNRGLDDMRGTS